MNIFKSLFQLIGIFFGGLSAKIQKVWLPLGVAVGNAAKEVVDLDSQDIIGGIAEQFGAKGGKELEDGIRTTVSNVVVKMDLAQQFLSLNDPNLIIQAVLKEIKSKTDDVKTLFWTNFVGLVVHDFADGHLSVLEALGLAGYYYKEHPQPTADAIAANIVELTAQTQLDGSVLYVPESVSAALANIPQNTVTAGSTPENKDAGSGTPPGATPENNGAEGESLQQHTQKLFDLTPENKPETQPFEHFDISKI